MLIQLVRFELPDADRADAFDALVATAIPLIREREPGTLTYRTFAVAGEPLVRVFYEEYADRAAHAEHERQPHTSRFLDGIRALVSRIEVEVLTETNP